MGFSPFRSVPDSEYLLTRSTTEAKLAASACTEAAAAAHREIVSSYLGKLFGPQEGAPSEAEPRTPANLKVREMVGPRIGYPERFKDVSLLTDNQELVQLLRRLD